MPWTALLRAGPRIIPVFDRLGLPDYWHKKLARLLRDRAAICLRADKSRRTMRAAGDGEVAEILLVNAGNAPIANFEPHMGRCIGVCIAVVSRLAAHQENLNCEINQSAYDRVCSAESGSADERGKNMNKLRFICMAAIGLCITGWATGQNPARAPTAEQLALTAAEDQLSDDKCGVPRNAGDDYRPAPMLSDQTRAPRVKDTQAFKIEVVASGLKTPYALAFLPDGKMLVSIRAGGVRLVSAGGKVSDPLLGAPEIVIVRNIREGGMQDIVPDRDFARNRLV